MAINPITDLLVQEYARQPEPVLSDDLRIFLRNELQRIEQSLTSLTQAAIQVADTPPENPVRGMVRYFVAPWAPLGASPTAGLVVYNGTAWVAV